MNFITAGILYYALRRENARRQKIYGPPPPPTEVQHYDSDEYKQRWGLEGMTRDEVVELGDDHPAFRYML